MRTRLSIIIALSVHGVPGGGGDKGSHVCAAFNDDVGLAAKGDGALLLPPPVLADWSGMRARHKAE